MEDIQHRIIWSRLFASASLIGGLLGVFTFGISSLFGAVAGYAASREKAIGKVWLSIAYVGIILSVAYLVGLVALTFLWGD